MRVIILFSIICLCYSCGQNKKDQDKTVVTDTQKTDTSLISGGNAANTPVADTITQAVSAIRDEYNRINTSNLPSKKYNFECDTEGTATYYSEGSNVVKIKIEDGFMGDNKLTTEYFYKNGSLILIYEVNIGCSAAGPDIRKEERTYVRNDKAIRFFEDQNEAACSTCEFNQDSKEYKLLKANTPAGIKSALCN